MRSGQERTARSSRGDLRARLSVRALPHLRIGTACSWIRT
jgi:hypothetical protein